MPDPNDAFSTLDDFLLSLAEGVTQAQAELARAGVGGPPGHRHTYQLPRVDFELKMNLQVVEDERLSTRYSKLRVAKATNKHLLFRPLAVEETSSTLEIAAVIKGAFVAVPVNNGLPPTRLEATVVTTNPSAPVLQVRAINAAGEPVSGLEVEVNLDREESELLTVENGQTFELASDTGFEQSVITTGAAGIAETTLTIGATQEPALLVLVIDADNQTETLIYEVER